MPGYLSIQLSFELMRLIPTELVTVGTTQLLNFARELRTSGSDTVVEEDLAAIFGRGHISPEIEPATAYIGFDDIMKTPMACGGQSAAFQWSTYRERAENELWKLIPSYRYRPAYIHLSAAVITGAMDFLYLAQSLPEDRKFTIQDQSGCMTLVIWVHFILGLSVVNSASDNIQVISEPLTMLKYIS
ncbi:hypothetical protein TSTA_099050 [Talaromyces stipitatus ATCC 10500]|uniref:Uncharacterized protein n=1 Tax=Talaromyces stipitatus (strain ATCC 10500 / CBS 375.48 / QM 6759 / NRRL 1006) TaxID=441959 RepID=B8MM96_TALSN|nr:uncharacterized protein TSTA_099050 [Talaromyces stipitatus ATCC 10500]EED13650.1 hypothetical protein TSTA_099050 [Talaromyces stipitatus ATCC 10500]